MTPPATRQDAEQAAMRRAIELARLGPAYGPNPRVGCVLLSPAGTVIGEGYHRGAGTPHAEVAAIADARAGLLAGATAIVTLEPCNHHGRTGPCTEALIGAGITRVVFGVPDPNLSASGGAARLAAAGIDVASGLLDAECTDVIARWALAVRTGRPHVTMKAAITLDGRTAAADGTSQWITGPLARDHAHWLRADMDAIIAGTGTVLADNPSLTARGGGILAAHQPLRAVVGMRDIPPGANVRKGPAPFEHFRTRDIGQVLSALYDLDARRVLVEGGATLAGAFAAAGLIDEVHAYLAPMLLGEGAALLPPFGPGTISEAWRLRPVEVTQLGPDLFWRLEKGE